MPENDIGDPKAISYQNWLNQFSTNKQLVGEADQSDLFAVHSIKRFIDEHRILWEVAQTYTGRVVVRSGQTDNLELALNWRSWETLHHVYISNE